MILVNVVLDEAAGVVTVGDLVGCVAATHFCLLGELLVYTFVWLVDLLATARPSAL